MSETKSPVDNAIIESFLRSVKQELITPNKHKSMSEMTVFIHEYLSDYFPSKLIHRKFKMTLQQLKENRLMSSNSLLTKRLQFPIIR